ncbi:MAG: class I SAM-dependent methyltransferase [Anaerolineales bacterium]
MADQDYEYRGMLAKTWDLFRGDTSQWPDRFFFRDIINQHGGRVLDVGCGTGRLLLDYMRDGIDIEGVDNSPEMLALCREKANQLGLTPSLYLQSMTTLDLPHPYGIIMVPSSSFQLVTGVEDARQTMDNFFRHLEPGGILIMPFMLFWEEGTPLDTGWVEDGEQPGLEEGVIIRRWSRSTYDPENQLEHTETRYETIVAGEITSTEFHSRSPATRWYTQVQARDLYLGAGFSNLQLYSEFSREPADGEDRIFCVVGSKPTLR